MYLLQLMAVYKSNSKRKQTTLATISLLLPELMMLNTPAWVAATFLLVEAASNHNFSKAQRVMTLSLLRYLSIPSRINGDRPLENNQNFAHKMQVSAQQQTFSLILRELKLQLRGLLEKYTSS